MVVILDQLTDQDIHIYRALLDKMPHRELLCGFLSGKEELTKWEPSDLFQLFYDTKPIIGSLDQLKSVIDADAVDRAIKIGVCNIYHGCVHNMLHGKKDKTLKGLYKTASFVVQAIAFRQNGSYFSRQQELLRAVSPEEKKILETAIGFKNGTEVDFETASENLFLWAQKHICD